MANSGGFSPTNQYEVISLTITDRYGQIWDMKNFLIELNAYHSLFQMCSTANLLVLDPGNLRVNSAIMGGELVTFKFRNSGLEEVITLKYVIKCQGELTSTDTTAAIRFQLITEDALRDSSIDVSLPHDGSYYKLVDNAFTLLSSSKKISITQPANTLAPGSTPYSSPLTTIRWVSTRSHASDLSPFLFYEDLDGYKFVDLGSLLRQESVGKFFKEPLGLTDTDGLRQMFTIRHLEYNEDNFNLLSMVKSKIENRNEFHFDIFTKTASQLQKEYQVEFQKLPSLDGFAFPSSNMGGQSNIWLDVLDDSSHLAKYARDLYENALSYYGIKIVTLAGDHLRVGNVYEYHPISNEIAQSGSKTKEKFLSGRYLLTNIKRTFRTDSYTTTSELVKDSLSGDVNNG